MRALPPTAGDLRGLASEHGAVPSAVVRLDEGRLRIECANVRFAALAGDACEGRPLDDVVTREGARPWSGRELTRAIGGALPATIGERAVEIGVAPLPDDGSFVITVHDVSDSAREVREPRETVGRLEDIMDNSAALIYVKDTEGRYMLVNQHFERRSACAAKTSSAAPTARSSRSRPPPSTRPTTARSCDGRAIEVEEPATGIRTAAGCRSSSRCSTRTGGPTRWPASRPTSPTASAPRPRPARPRRGRARQPRPRASSSRA